MLHMHVKKWLTPEHCDARQMFASTAFMLIGLVFNIATAL